MPIQLASLITGWISQSGYWGLFLLMVGESFLMPIPSEIVLPFAGFMVFSGEISFLAAVFLGVLGQIFGSVLSYYLGYYGGRRVVLRYGQYFLLNKKHFEHVENWFNKYGLATVFVCRLLPVVRTLISFPAGITKMNFKKFLLYSTLGIIPWTIFLVYLGVRLGSAWESIIKTFDELQIFVIIGLIAFAVWWVWKEIRERKHNHEQLKI